MFRNFCCCVPFTLSVFCCCIPARVGVFIISLTLFLGWGILSATSLFVLSQVLTHSDHFHITTGEKLGWGSAGAVFAIFSLIALFGFIGSATRRHHFVKGFARLIWGIWFLNIVVSGLLVVAIAFARKKNNFNDACQSTANNPLNQKQQDDCQKLLKDLRSTGFLVGWAIGTIIIIIWNFYGCLIVTGYVRQLEKEQAYVDYTRDPAFNTPDAPKSFYPHDRVNQSTELLNTPAPPPGGYPYADPHHSFGGNNDA